MGSRGQTNEDSTIQDPRHPEAHSRGNVHHPNRSGGNPQQPTPCTTGLCPYRWSSGAHSWAFPGRKISQGPTTDSRHNHQDHFSTEVEPLQTARTRPLGKVESGLLTTVAEVPALEISKAISASWRCGLTQRQRIVSPFLALSSCGGSTPWTRWTGESGYPQDFQGTLQAFRHSAGSATGSRADDSFPGPGGCSGLNTFHKVNLHILINIMSFPLIITSYLCCISYFLFELVFSCSVQLLASSVHS